MDEILGTHRYKRIQGEFFSGRILEPAKPTLCSSDSDGCAGT
jgi:hypothetical protein